MERSISTLTYKGSIPEAILEAKRQRKLFVVYISGADKDSIELEKSTWTDLKVAESLSKYCILLHIREGSTDATNFCAIYPQKSVPSVAAIGYNGVQLWQSEGFVSAEVLASSLEKACLSLHIQETATVVTAALASKKSEPLSGSSDTGLSGQGSSSNTVVPSPSLLKHTQSSEARLLEASEMIEENKSQEHLLEDKKTVLDDKSLPESFNADKAQSVQDEPTEEAKGLPSPLMVDPNNSTADHMSSDAEKAYIAPENSIGHHSGVAGGDSLLAAETHESVRNEKVEHVDDRKVDALNNNARVNVLTDVHLSIRLPNGVSLQEKFSVTSALGIVKDYVDSNQASSIGAYDLAIPYPRKVFSDQDLSKPLSELGLFNRQALIVIPRQRATTYHRGGSSPSGQTSRTSTGSSNENDGGYFSYVKRIISYINPLSYLGGNASSSSSGQAQTGMWEYSPNPSLQNNLARAERPYSSYSPNESNSASQRNDNKGRQPITSRSGGNIHTLKHDDDDGRFSDRNSFWNGNSTQFGGNNDGK